MNKHQQLKQRFIKSKVDKVIFFNITIENYIFRKSGIVRKFSTKQEKSCSIMHEIEYKEYGLKVRSKRNSALIDDREDKSSDFDKAKKDWKRNSKRKHQYYK